MKREKTTITEFGFRMILGIIKPHVCVICTHITQTLVLMIYYLMLNVIQ